MNRRDFLRGMTAVLGFAALANRAQAEAPAPEPLTMKATDAGQKVWVDGCLWVSLGEAGLSAAGRNPLGAVRWNPYIDPDYLARIAEMENGA